MLRPHKALALTLGLLLPAALALVSVPGPTAGGAPASAKAQQRNAVVETRLVGRSVRGRAIKAFHLGEAGKPKVLLISSMHGDEQATRQILWSLKNGRPIRGIDLWVVPTYNPDGIVRNTRKNARGVDLNRNFPYRWTDLDGAYESGPRAASEPETRAMMRFLRDIRPKWILSFHQPLHGVDTDTKNRRFARKVARKLDLPAKRFDCGGVCHGTMTMWYNHGFRGSALTVEYGSSPSRRQMRVQAPRQILSIWGARRR